MKLEMTMAVLLVRLCVWILSRLAPHRLASATETKPEVSSLDVPHETRGLCCFCAVCRRRVYGWEPSHWPGREAARAEAIGALCHNCFEVAHCRDRERRAFQARRVA